MPWVRQENRAGMGCRREGHPGVWVQRKYVKETALMKLDKKVELGKNQQDGSGRSQKITNILNKE